MKFIEKFKAFAKNLISNEEIFDPSVLDDEVAMKTGWEPLTPEGASFCTHKLRQTLQSRVEFQARYLALLLPVAFMAAGLGALMCMILAGIQNIDMISLCFGIVVGTVFFLVGLWMFFKMKTKSIFDKSVGYFWQGKFDPILVQDDIGPNYCKLDQIHALQIVRQRIRGSDSNYYSYELNLILKSGRRLNAMDHGKIRRLREDAETLGKFLGVPVWDIT